MSTEIIKETLVRGEPWAFEFTILEDGVAYDVDLLDVKIQLRAETTDGKLVGEWVEGDTKITKTAGLVTLLIPPSITRTYKFKKAYIDLLLISADDTDDIRSDTAEITLHRGVTDQ